MSAAPYTCALPRGDLSAWRTAGPNSHRPRISGQTIIDELIRNMELGRLEMGYSILLPCIFSVYLHPDDYARLAGVQDLIKEDARRALNARMAEWNGKNALFRRGGAAQDRIESHRTTGGSNCSPTPKAPCRRATWRSTRS